MEKPIPTHITRMTICGILNTDLPEPLSQHLLGKKSLEALNLLRAISSALF